MGRARWKVNYEQTERPTEAGHNGVGESGHDYCEP
jgi:hypothetical protein